MSDNNDKQIAAAGAGQRQERSDGKLALEQVGDSEPVRLVNAMNELKTAERSSDSGDPQSLLVHVGAPVAGAPDAHDAVGHESPAGRDVAKHMLPRLTAGLPIAVVLSLLLDILIDGFTSFASYVGSDMTLRLGPLILINLPLIL